MGDTPTSPGIRLRRIAHTERVPLDLNTCIERRAGGDVAIC